jgi:DNA-binding GntR family transcriptional regulator
MKRYGDGIPNKVLREIFPRRINRSLAAEQIYSHIKRAILSGKLRKGQKLFRVKIAQDFGVNIMTVAMAFFKLKKHRLVIVKRGVGSFVA